ncbi:MAG: phage capsid protein [Ahrensia sp.]|nr:phage capsid protein [Ahrensia sp.]
MTPLEEFDLDRMSVDEKEIVYQSGAMALGRATDIEIYNKTERSKTGGRC